MRTAVLVEPGRFVIEERPVPRPGREEVLIKISRVGICGTDMHIFNGKYALESLPLVLGHEFAGTIAKMGADAIGLETGQRVVVDMNIGCNSCYWCRRNEILNCPDMSQIGINVDGAFSEYIVVPSKLVIPALTNISFSTLCLTEPLACVVRAARKASVTFGQSVVVLGAGPIGNLHVQLLRVIGAAPIIVFDISEDRVLLAQKYGADFGATNPELLESMVMEATDGRGVDLAIESVGIPSLYATALKLIRKGGHIAAFGLTEENETLPLNILTTVLQENSVKGSVAGMGQNMHDALTLLSHGRINPEPFLGSVFPLSDIQEAFDSHVERRLDLKTQISMTDE